MGDVQGRHVDDSDGTMVVTASDPKDKLRPPDRLVMFREARPTYNVPGAAFPIAVDGKATSKRRKNSPSGASGSPNEAGVLEQGTDGIGRRPSKSKPPSAGLSSSNAGSSPTLRGSPMTQSRSGQATDNKGTVGRQLKQQCIEAKIQPLAEAVIGGNSANRDQLLVFEELDRVRTTRRPPFHPDRSSPDSNGSSRMTVTSDQSGSCSSSDGSSSVGPPHGRWRQRWCIDKVGREPGQIRCIKDLCMLRSGSLVATEPKNFRLQMFAKTGKTLVALGPDSEDMRTARSFGNPLAFRRMQPSGVVETVVDNLVAVTDLNRVLYIEALQDGMMDGEVFIKGKTELRGIATTWNSKIILTEIGSKASVAQYETSGKFICEYKGNFRKPCHVAHDSIYNVTAVSDSERGLVFLYDASGNPLTRFGSSRSSAASKGNRRSSSAGHLVYPSGLCWSSHGRLLVADEALKKVVAFDLRNLTAETVLSAADGLKRPVTVACDFRDLRNRIYVAEEVFDFGVNQYYLKMFEQRSLNNWSTSQSSSEDTKF